jgi:hyperosmotically inducible periplasmic protein
MMTLPARTSIALMAVALLAGLAGCHRAGDATRADLGEGRGQHVANAPITAAPPTTPPAAAASRATEPQPHSVAASTAPAARRPAAADTRTMGAPSSSLAAAIASAAPERVDDASITRGVSAAIAADRELRRLRIDVDTQNGIVTLSGPAPTASAKAHADEVARTVAGVVSVNNQLTLQTG